MGKQWGKEEIKCIVHLEDYNDNYIMAPRVCTMGGGWGWINDQDWFRCYQRNGGEPLIIYSYPQFPSWKRYTLP